MHYCMSDLHGCFEAFRLMLEKINFQGDDELYIIGDAIDRGKESLALIDYIKTSPNITLLKGNHELMAIESLKKLDQQGDIDALWRYNGGDTTYQDLLKRPDSEMKEMLAYLQSCPDYLELKVNNSKYLLVHGGFDPKKYSDIKECQTNELLWYRGPFFSTPYQDKTLIMGHIPTIALVPYIEKALLMRDFDTRFYSEQELKEAIKMGNQHEIILVPKRIFIDCGKVFGYKLGCLRLEDLQTFYV